MTTPVEELRSAAVLLRQRAECAQQLMPGPWRVVGTDSESLDGVASCPLHEAGPHDACDACSVIETHSEWVASFVALLPPTVGLALAELFDHISDDMDDDGAEEAPIAESKLVVRSTIPATFWRWDWTAALALARLILGGTS